MQSTGILLAGANAHRIIGTAEHLFSGRVIHSFGGFSSENNILLSSKFIQLTLAHVPYIHPIAVNIELLPLETKS